MLMVTRLNLNMSDTAPGLIAVYLSFFQYIFSDLQEAAHIVFIVDSEKGINNDLMLSSHHRDQTERVS